jgi:hypothetical protein
VGRRASGVEEPPSAGGEEGQRVRGATSRGKKLAAGWGGRRENLDTMLEPLTLTKLDCYITVKTQTCLTTRDLGGQYESSCQTSISACYLSPQYGREKTVTSRK